LTDRQKDTVDLNGEFEHNSLLLCILQKECLMKFPEEHFLLYHIPIIQICKIINIFFLKIFQSLCVYVRMHVVLVCVSV